MILARNWKEKPALNVDRSQFKHQENGKREWLRTQTNFPLQCKANVKEISADVILFPSQENVKGVTGSSRCQSPISEPLNHHRHLLLVEASLTKSLIFSSMYLISMLYKFANLQQQGSHI